MRTLWVPNIENMMLDNHIAIYTIHDQFSNHKRKMKIYTITHLILTNPKRVRSLTNTSPDKGSVKMSVNWSSNLQNSNSTLPFSTLYLRKWCLISICFVLKCQTGILEILVAHVLSQRMRTLLNSIPKSFIRVFIHNNCA